MRTSRAGDMDARSAAFGGGSAGPLYLIHTNKVPKPVFPPCGGTLKGRQQAMKTAKKAPDQAPPEQPLKVSIRDPEGVPLHVVMGLLDGRLSPIEFLMKQRTAHVVTEHRS